MEKDIFDSKIFKAIIIGIGGLIVLSLVFGLGVFVGAKRAEFSFKWAEAYHRNFGGPPGGFFGDIMDMGRQVAPANGVFGEIININDKILTIKGIDSIEKSVLVADKTAINFQRKNEKLSDLSVGDSIVVIGQPNSEGQIEAKFIRVMPKNQLQIFIRDFRPAEQNFIIN